MKLIFSGIVIPISTIDWYGRSVSVIFFNGCNFKCLYCSNNSFIKVANQRIEPLYIGGSVEEIEVRTTVFRPFSDVLGIARALVGRECTYVIQQGIPENAPEGEIRKEKVLTRDEMIVLARSIPFLKDVRIRTKEKGEEKIL